MWPVFWIGLTVVLVLIESATYQLLCAWFAVGALIATFVAFAHGSVVLQWLVFLVTSLLFLVAIRPVVKKRLRLKKVATNADAVIGQIGVVLSDINNDAQSGRVKANGLDWSARNTGVGTIPKGTKVQILGIEGVKLIVEPIVKPAMAEKE